ncbi:MAG: hypothetical protein J7605_05230 [Variovorax sp.]|nr:hypothetical protein [Variovorax sp.]
MRNELLSFMFVLSITFNASASESTGVSPFELRSLGQCFESTRNFIRHTLGDPALTDPNITNTEKNSWIWIVDQTASKNYAWYLLERVDEKICFRAFVPMANDVRFKDKSFLHIEATTAPDAGFPIKLIQLKAQSRRGPFKPSHCYLANSNARGIAANRRQVNCNQIFD